MMASVNEHIGSWVIKSCYKNLLIRKLLFIYFLSFWVSRFLKSFIRVFTSHWIFLLINLNNFLTLFRSSYCLDIFLTFIFSNYLLWKEFFSSVPWSYILKVFQCIFLPVRNLRWIFFSVSYDETDGKILLLQLH